MSVLVAGKKKTQSTRNIIVDNLKKKPAITE